MKHFISILILLATSLALPTWLVNDVLAQTNWEKYLGNPVLDRGLPGAWDEEWVFIPEVFFDGALYRMWYTGWDGSNLRIGYATSPEGIIWTKLNDPVLDGGPPGSWDVSVSDASIIYDGTTYHMWYRGQDDGNTPLATRIGYATSPDGVIWTKYDDPTTVNPPFAESDPVMNPGDPGSWDSVWILGPTVIFDGTTYHMWYMGWDGNIPRFGYATSPDGINWTKYDDPTTVNPPFAESDPVMNPGDPGSWDVAAVLSPSVIYDGTSYQMWYSGGDSLISGLPFPTESKIGYATSPNGITWTKFANPVLEAGAQGTWDGITVGDPDVIYDGTTYHMWYTGGGWDGEFRFRIGYATDSLMVVDIDIKPRHCPNFLDIERNGVISVAIVGTENLDVSTINSESVRLEGIAPIRGRDRKDITRPVVERQDVCDCTAGGPDDIPDLPFRFSIRDLAIALGDLEPRDEVEVVLTLTGQLRDGTLFEGKDCVIIKSKRLRKSVAESEVSVPESYALAQNYPNPFNPETEIRFQLPEAGHAIVRIYNTLGQEIRTLTDREYEAGFHRLRWDGRDNNGNLVASSIYLYQMQAGSFSQIRKMTLLR